ncbi:MAG: hypothetical protein H0W65_03680 [Sphingomonas sp.]|uniref:ORC-CDC6 family AAA ATPase n=1 Tax=Sphingomonas sp. TaxID=28214 RepID=UPI0017DF0791|nr:hypothetical protein [Sphingomonas sp.]MBA3666806.1 hypothetical protein [Sphingomonas sp.]
MEIVNPFEYEAASSLDPDRISEWFIDDHNYARFIKSRRNVILDGDRGSGKSMILVYHAIENEMARASARSQEPDLSNVGIYVPSNNPLLQRAEHEEVLESAQRSIISERYLTYTIVAAIGKGLRQIESYLDAAERAAILDEIRYLMPSKRLDEVSDPFTYVTRFVRDALRMDQEALAKGLDFDFNFDTSSFYIHILPLLEALRNTKALSQTHFSLLIDDAHMLDPYQQRIINSWLGYRDHSLFSLKVAIAGLRNYDLGTTFGGNILEGHDYTAVNLYRPFQNLDSEYGRFAVKVVERRLKQAGIAERVQDFFPTSESFTKDLSNAKGRAEKLAISRGIDPNDRKAFNDFRYKFGRALYFRDRSRRANKPQYSGFETISHLSTGVVRSLLNICYAMFEREVSLRKTNPSFIRTDVQRDVILEASDKQWEFVRGELDKSIAHCTPEDAVKIARLLRRLAEYFRGRLLHHESEPRVLVFSISAFDPLRDAELVRLLDLAEEAQLLYVRSGTAKSGGGRENYYVVNRMLFPQYGLDVQGQHGRASLRAEDLLGAANHDKAFPNTMGIDPPLEQGTLFDV